MFFLRKKQSFMVNYRMVYKDDGYHEKVKQVIAEIDFLSQMTGKDWEK